MSNYSSPKIPISDIIKTLDMNVKAKESNAKTDYEKGYLQALVDVTNYYIKMEERYDRLVGGAIHGYGHDC